MKADLTPLLRTVSRSFYLTLRALPSPVRPAIGLAYLLARPTDTIADTELIAVDLRLQALEHLRERIMGRSTAPLDFSALAQNQTLAAEGALLRRVEEALQSLDSCMESDRGRIRAVLEIIISGQELDLRRFGSAGVQKIIALSTDVELDDYTFRVAGCVGQFWTDMCLAHLFEFDPKKTARMRENGIRFGQGLQLVNILRDLPLDLRKGRCYLPAARLAQAGLSPSDLLSPDAMKTFRPLYDLYLDRAEIYLTNGWDYANDLPRNQRRLRLACAWPVLIGAETLRRLRAENVLDAARRIKISRADVRKLIARSILLYPWPALWRRQFQSSSNDIASPPIFRYKEPT